MNNSKTFNNPWIISLTLGISSIVGFSLGKMFGQHRMSANYILKVVVRDFKKEGTVEGSWIDHRIRPYQRFAFKTDVYNGGIQRREDGQLVNYLFTADAFTGSVLQIKRVDD